MKFECRLGIFAMALFCQAGMGWTIAETPGFSNTAYLVIGGGYNPHGSQVVLESNMKLFDESANYFGVSAEGSVTRLFGGGNNPLIKDVAIADPNFPLEEKLFAKLFESSNCPECTLRHNQLTNLDGPSTKAEVVGWLGKISSLVDERDALRLYYTGHGGQGGSKAEENFMSLWRSFLDVEQFTAELDKLPAKTNVQIVMVQCYSGGFAQINHEGGNPQNAISKANRCGFFAQVPTMPAAGCSPDLNEREEYSPYFFGALLGHDERGNEVNADFDGNGIVGSDEAHANVIINEESIDNPVSTSSQLLRESGLQITPEDLKTSWDQLASEMNATEKSIVSELVKKAELSFWSPVPPAVIVDRALKALEAQKKDVGKAIDAASSQFSRVRKSIGKDFEDLYPIFESAYVSSGSLLSEARQAFLNHDKLEEFKSANASVDAASEEAMKLRRALAKLRRLNYLLETKLFERKLKTEGSSELRDKYQSLKACESESFFKRAELPAATIAKLP